MWFYKFRISVLFLSGVELGPLSGLVVGFCGVLLPHLCSLNVQEIIGVRGTQQGL